MISDRLDGLTGRIYIPLSRAWQERLTTAVEPALIIIIIIDIFFSPRDSSIDHGVETRERREEGVFP